MKNALLTLLLLCGAIGYGQPAPIPARAVTNLAATDGAVVTEVPGLVQLRFTTPLVLPGKTPTAIAAELLAAYARLLGLRSADDAEWLDTRKGLNGVQYLRYRQLHLGLPVFGTGFTVAITPDGRVKGLTGTVFPATSFAPAPRRPTTPVDYTDLAAAALTDRHPYAKQWTVTEQEPVFTRQNPWDDNANASLHRARVFVVAEPAGHRAYRVFLEAATGRLLFRHQLDCDLTRRLYHANTAGFNSVWREGDAFPGSLDGEDQEMLMATAETYHLFHRTFGRSSFDGRGSEMRAITNAALNNCPNASARGNVIRHCRGVVGDDIVAHEWTHNYIVSMNGLIYAFESGAINEAYADIFGEAVDLLNDRGLDTNDDLFRVGCDDNNLRWQIAEDATALDTTLRDLWMPECRYDPSFVGSPLYVCPNANDSRGDVHSNSGPVRRAFTLLVDGGTLNGDTVRAIGMTKALHLFHHVNNVYITPVTDFFAFGQMLELAASDLLGVDLPALTLLDLPAMNSGEAFTPADIEQVLRAVRATQLKTKPDCTVIPTLAPNPPAPCAEATINVFSPFFTQTWEDSLGGWRVAEQPVVDSTWESKPWAITSLLPDGRPGLGVFAPNPRIGDCRTDFENGTTTLVSPSFTLPTTESEFILTFDHYYATQDEYDGGLLQVSKNGGAFQSVTNGAFLFNGYDGRLASVFNSDNPLAGKQAFHGADRNSTSGSWGRSIVDLNAAGLQSGDEVRLSWVFGQDGCDGRLGWYLDDVRVGFCGESALPVSWLRFTATAGKDFVDLDWQTADERDNYGFYVERKAADQTTFVELGFVAAGADYRFRDLAVAAGATYVYRLRQVDADGSWSYSPLVVATLAETADQLSVFPNPAGAWLNVRYRGQATLAQLYDATGRQVRRATLVANAARLPLAGLAPGAYWLRVDRAVKRVVVR